MEYAYYVIEVRSVDGAWSEIERARASGYYNLLDTFEKMCANSTGAELRLIKVIRSS